MLVRNNSLKIRFWFVTFLDGAHKLVETTEAVDLVGVAEFRGIKRTAQHGYGLVVCFQGDGERMAVLAAECEREARRP